ncbi:MAG: hypothetical protein U9O41_08775 [Candidatus Aerophobetes bacterium]|nr:hypothetical protein [Candidatus Aerophobetes bacterium]
MKKLLIIVMILIFLPTLAFANSPALNLSSPANSSSSSTNSSKTTGWLMLLVGIGLAVDGFQQIRVPTVIKTEKTVDVSDPELTIYDVVWKSDVYTYDVDGMAKNTGNCTLEYIKIHVKFYEGGELIGTDSTHLDDEGDLPIGQCSSWFTSYYGGGAM